MYEYEVETEQRKGETHLVRLDIERNVYPLRDPPQPLIPYTQYPFSGVASSDSDVCELHKCWILVVCIVFMERVNVHENAAEMFHKLQICNCHFNTTEINT